MLMTSDGQSIRIRCSDVRETGRAAQGVKLVTLKGGEKLQDIARVMPDDEEASEDSDESADDDTQEEAQEGGEVATQEAAETPEASESDDTDDSGGED